jgi:4-amino-4-deoxy-L-arabinose transferase-like glycosyltransferase
MQRFKTELGLFVALLLSNAIILFDNTIWFESLHFSAAVVIPFVLPGWAWLPVLGWARTTQAVERLILIIGLSSLFTATALLITLFLPGPFIETPVLIALNLIILSGLIAQFVKNSPSPIANRQSKIEWPVRTILLILVAIIAVAAFTRLTRIGYAEFHEDELENMRLIVRAYKGEEYAPFLDSKGPIHWLLPAAVWYLNGWLNEGLARTPFAITGLLLIPLMYTLGRRVSGGRDSIGLIAAGFVALNGFFVAYARYVENQSLIVFWGGLALWFAYRAYSEKIYHFYLYVALALGVGLVAHPDVLLYLPVFAYVIGWHLWQQRAAWRRQWPWLAAGGLLFGGVVAFFYIPYFFDPRIGLIYQYFSADRLGDSLLYNRVYNLFDQDQLYSTRYHAPVLVLLWLWLLARNFAHWGWRGGLILAGLGLAMVSTVQWPELWLVNNINFAFAPYALLTLLFILLPRTTFELRTLFLWMMVPLGALLFLAKDAADHIQIAYPAWGLLAAFALVDLWNFLSQIAVVPSAALIPTPHRVFGITPAPWSLTRIISSLKIVLVITLTCLVGLILFYQYLAFGATVTHYWQVKTAATNDPNSIYNRLYGSIPRPRKIFSNPRLSGWKAVGYLWATGTLTADFRSINDSFAVPIWYTFETPRSCYEDPKNYWVRRDWQGWPDEGQPLVEQGYTLTRVVLVDQEPKLHLYEKGVTVTSPEVIDVEDYRHKFDRQATPARFAQEETGQHPAAFNFGGDRLRLSGYDFPTQAFAPGEVVRVTAYWETLAPMDTRYRAFMHLEDEQGQLWAQHDDDPACRLLTTDMRPGQRSSRQFRLPLDPNTPPGRYTVSLGLYNPDTLERLEIWDATAEQNSGDQLILGQIAVK